jgi:hypothetical protein
MTTAAAYAQHQPSAPWLQTDVGDVGIAGSATEGSDGDLFINGAGSDIWGSADSFHFLYQTIYDGEIGSNPARPENTNPHAKLGLMIRLTLAPDSPHVIIDIQPDGSVEFMQRLTPGGETTFISGIDAGVSNYWYLRLVRASGVITGYACTGGPQGGCRTVGTASFPDGPALAGAVITSHDPGVLNHGYVAAALPWVYTVPSGWSHFDVGTVGLPGNAFYDTHSNTFIVEGAGDNIWGTSDSYHIVSHPFSGDGQIIARVTAEDAADTFAKAGVVLTDNYGATVILDRRPNGVIEFMSRPAAGAPMSFIAGTAAQLPIWLRLTRIGNQFEAFISDVGGASWSFVGFTEVAMRSDITAGLAVTSRDVSAINTSKFDNVVVGSGNFTNVDIGDVGAPGGFRTNSDATLTQWGSGADIWATEDAFNYEYHSLVNDGSMTLYVTSLDDTNEFAKVGIMIRHLIDPTSKHVTVDATPSGHVEFLMRDTWGGETTYIGGGSFEFPLYLRLERSGASITASAAHAGSAPTVLGTVSPDLPPEVYIGTAVTSHSRGVTASATFTH